MCRTPAADCQPEKCPGIAVPESLAEDERRVAILVELLGKIDPRDREAILSDAISRASSAQQMAELTQAVQDLTAKLRA